MENNTENKSNTINNQTNPRITVKHLRQNGFKVRVGHYRWTDMAIMSYGQPTLQSDITSDDFIFNDSAGINPKGGKTTIELTKDGIDAKGEAICCLEDNYNRKLGVKIALGRALAAWQAKKSWPCMPDQKIKLIAPVEG